VFHDGGFAVTSPFALASVLRKVRSKRHQDFARAAIHHASKTKMELPSSIGNLGNIGIFGRRLRYRIGWLALAGSIAAAIWFLFKPWTPWRLVVFFPLVGAATSLLEARRSTCIARAFSGTREDDAGAAASAPACDLPSNRQAAARIVRDAVILGATGTTLLLFL
jgi:hypothetical protein